MMSTSRERFEDAVFNAYFVKSIKRNPSPPRGTGAMDFVATATKTKAELLARDGDGYADEAISAMWFGWELRDGAPRDAERLMAVSAVNRMVGHVEGVLGGLLGLTSGDLRTRIDEAFQRFHDLADQAQAAVAPTDDVGNEEATAEAAAPRR